MTQRNRFGCKGVTRRELRRKGEQGSVTNENAERTGDGRRGRRRRENYREHTGSDGWRGRQGG